MCTVIFDISYFSSSVYLVMLPQLYRLNIFESKAGCKVRFVEDVEGRACSLS